MGIFTETTEKSSFSQIFYQILQNYCKKLSTFVLCNQFFVRTPIKIIIIFSPWNIIIPQPFSYYFRTKKRSNGACFDIWDLKQHHIKDSSHFNIISFSSNKRMPSFFVIQIIFTWNSTSQIERIFPKISQWPSKDDHWTITAEYGRHGVAMAVNGLHGSATATDKPAMESQYGNEWKQKHWKN